MCLNNLKLFDQKKKNLKLVLTNKISNVNLSEGIMAFECYELLYPAPQLTITKISTYIIYLYVFISVKTALQLNRLWLRMVIAV